MNLKKLLVIIFLFYFFALLQNSFLIYFDLFGAIPNLVFILFFLLVFFEKKNKVGQTYNNYIVVSIAILAGTFSDIFSYVYLGISIIILMIIGITLKNIQLALMNTEENYPFIYFLPLFIISLLVYNFVLDLYIFAEEPIKIITFFSIGTVISLIYNLFIASVLFYIYKKGLKFSNNV
jgi:hypothetical protein